MKQLKLTFMILLVTLLVLGVRAQHSDSMNTRFDKGDLSFDYPANWKLTDGGTADVQSVTVVPKGGGAEIAVIVQAGINASCDFQVENRRIMHGLVRRLATRIQTAATPLQTSPVKIAVGKLEVDGTQMRGKINGKPVTGEIYSLRLNRHFLSLVYLRADHDDSTASAWATIRQTLALANAAPVTVASSSPAVGKPGIALGAINGRALHLAQPSYPAIARQAHASGTVVVQVLIDENGDVAEGHAIAGHPLLQPASVAAARASKFSPTKLCDEPVRVAGLIEYNFVSQ